MKRSPAFAGIYFESRRDASGPREVVDRPLCRNWVRHGLRALCIRRATTRNRRSHPPGTAGVSPAFKIMGRRPALFSFSLPPRAAPTPCFRQAHEACLDGISLDVGNRLSEMPLITDESVEVLAEPEGAGAPEDLVGGVSGVRLP